MKCFIPAPFGYLLSWLPDVITVHGPCVLEPQMKWLPKCLSNWYSVDGMSKAYCNRSDIVQVQINSKDDIEPTVKCLASTMNLEIICKPSDMNKSLTLLEPQSRDWCILQLSPLISKKDIAQLYDYGFRQFQCHSFVLSLLPYSLDQVKYLKTNFQDVVVIGGGINSDEILHSYKQVGVDHIAFGQVWFHLWFFITWFFQHVLDYWRSI